jgi:hypothetical protein
MVPVHMAGAVSASYREGWLGPLPTALMMASMMPCWVTVAVLRLNNPNPYCPLTPLSQ